MSLWFVACEVVIFAIDETGTKDSLIKGSSVGVGVYARAKLVNALTAVDGRPSERQSALS